MEKIDRLAKHPDYMLYLRRNRDLEKNRIFCLHDFDHLLTVARLTYILLLERGEQPSIKETAYAAGLLHDIGRWQEYTAAIDHARAGANLARPILKEAGFEPTAIELIGTAIREHRHAGRTGDNRHPLSRALYEADQFSRPCFKCPAVAQCRKYQQMPHKKKLIY